MKKIWNKILDWEVPGWLIRIILLIILPGFIPILICDKIKGVKGSGPDSQIMSIIRLWLSLLIWISVGVISVLLNVL